MAKQRKVYDGLDRPDVEVFVDGAWWPGELRAWTQHGDDTWTGSVVWHRDGETRSGTFPAEAIRADDTDHTPAGWRPDDAREV